MTTPIARTAAQGLQRHAAAPRSGTAAACMARPASPAVEPMEQVMALDLQTSWPTHRIRSFLSLRPR